ncbi:MAG: hypothetical protein V1855_01430, partial [bacterium]
LMEKFKARSEMNWLAKLLIGMKTYTPGKEFELEEINKISLEYIESLPEDAKKTLYGEKATKKHLSEVLNKTNPKGTYTLHKFCVNEGLFLAAKEGYVNIVNYFIENFENDIETKVISKAIDKTENDEISRKLKSLKEKKDKKSSFF